MMSHWARCWRSCTRCEKGKPSLDPKEVEDKLFAKLGEALARA